MTDIPVVRASVRIVACDGFTLIDQIPARIHQRVLDFCGAQRIELLDIHDDAIAIANDHRGILKSFLEKTIGMTVAIEADFVQAGKDGVMVALFLDPTVGARLEVEDGEKPSDMHVTIAYLGSADELDEKKIELVRLACQTTAASFPPLEGFIAGLGRFSNPENDVLYASPDLPGLSEMRSSLVNALDLLGVPPKKNHDFTPHITLKYMPANAENPYVRLPRSSIFFDEIVLAIGGKREAFKLSGKMKAAAGRQQPPLRRMQTPSTPAVVTQSLGDRIKARLGHW